MDLIDVQLILNKMESNSYDIRSSLTTIIRITQNRLDIEELLFCRLINVPLSKENSNNIYESVNGISIKKGMSKEQYKKTYQKVIKLLVEVKKCNWYDPQNKKLLNDQVITYSLSEIIINLDQLQGLLGNNKVPEGLAPLDTYYANESKKTMDNIIYNHIINYQTVISRIKDYLFEYLLKVENELLSDRESEEMDIRKELELLIKEGYYAKEKCFIPDPHYFDTISGSEYVTWIEKSKMFIKKYIDDEDIYKGYVRIADKANGFGEGPFNEMIGRLTAFLSYDFTKTTKTTEEVENQKISKIFISHSSNDVNYVSHLVQLLNDIGIKKNQENIFCSSLPGYGIPYGENIYDFLKSELNKSNIMVLFVLSHNYYESAPCLNEMGAAWISSKEYNSILTPNFDFRKISGALDPSKISFKMDDKDGLNKFKDKMVEIFDLEDVNYQIWEEDREKFVKEIRKFSKVESETMGTQISIEKVKKGTANNIELQLRFNNVTDQDLEFKFIDIELTDSYGNKMVQSVEEEHLDQFKLFSRENKIVTWEFSNEQNDYNPRRDVKNLSTVSFELY